MFTKNNAKVAIAAGLATVLAAVLLAIINIVILSEAFKKWDKVGEETRAKAGLAVTQSFPSYLCYNGRPDFVGFVCNEPYLNEYKEAPTAIASLPVRNVSVWLSLLGKCGGIDYMYYDFLSPNGLEVDKEKVPDYLLLPIRQGYPVWVVITSFLSGIRSVLPYAYLDFNNEIPNDIDLTKLLKGQCREKWDARTDEYVCSPTLRFSATTNYRRLSDLVNIVMLIDHGNLMLLESENVEDRLKTTYTLRLRLLSDIESSLYIVVKRSSETAKCMGETDILPQAPKYGDYRIGCANYKKYQCIGGLSTESLQSYQVLLNAYQSNTTVSFLGLTGDYTFITAVYTGAITNAYAAVTAAMVSLLIATAVYLSIN